MTRKEAIENIRRAATEAAGADPNEEDKRVLRMVESGLALLEDALEIIVEHRRVARKIGLPGAQRVFVPRRLQSSTRGAGVEVCPSAPTNC